MKKFFSYIWNYFFKYIVGVFFNFEKKEIKIQVLILNLISITLLWMLLDVHQYLKSHAKTASEFATSFAIFLGAFLGIYGTMVLSIYKGKQNVPTNLVTNNPISTVVNSVGDLINKSNVGGVQPPTATTPANSATKPPAQVLQ